MNTAASMRQPQRGIHSRVNIFSKGTELPALTGGVSAGSPRIQVRGKFIFLWSICSWEHWKERRRDGSER